MNAWNMKWRYVRAFLDSDNDPTITLDVDLHHGVSKANLEQAFVRWQSGLRNFKKEALAMD